METSPGRRGRSRERAIAIVAAVLLVLGVVTAVTHPDRVDGESHTAPTAATQGPLPPTSVDESERAQAERAAGCELLVDGRPLEDRDHLDPDALLPAESLYPADRPAHSGRHLADLLAVPDGVAPVPIDERVVLHNMEHGSVVVWFDPGAVDDAAVQAMGSWLVDRLDLGFVSRAAGAVFVSPATVIDSGHPVAFRAWGVALDCDRFDVTVADAFLQRHWGSRGASPEAHLSPFPAGVMGESGTTV